MREHVRAAYRQLRELGRKSVWSQRFTERWRRLRLASKLSLIVAVIGITGLALGALTLDHTIRPAFERLEEESVQRQVGRASALLAGFLSSIENDSRDYGVWDGSYEYAATRDPAFEQETLTPLVLANSGLNAISYARLDGDLIYSLYVHSGEETEVPALSRAFGEVATSERILRLAQERSSFSTFVQFDGRIFVLGGAQVVRSDGTGPARGFVLMARELTAEAARAALQVDAAITLSGPSETRMERLSSLWRVQVPIVTSDGAPIGALAFESPRTITRLGASTLLSALLTSALIMAVALLGLFLIMRAVVVLRLRGIDDHMRDVAGSGELKPLSGDPSSDEVGSLSRSFNDMLAQLKELREQVEIQSYALGRSESAASAIHNVRNSLNPVTVILSQALSEQAPVNSNNVAQALSELARSDTDPVRRERLAAFVAGVIDDAERRSAVRHKSLLTARLSLSEALDILNVQNEKTHKAIALEQFDILEVIEKNVSLARFAPWGELDIDMPRQPEVIVRSNRLLMSQVIGNLLTNAAESIIAADRRPGRVAIAVTRVTDGAGDTVTISIADDGQGFDPSLAPKLFERGFSSKKGRAGGLGLHWCANTIKSIGGILTLESDGVGKGARAVIVLSSDSECTRTDPQDELAA